jgi:hypothetical protein
MFKGNVHSYGLIYNNKFELSHGIIEFTDILEHQETVHYAPQNQGGVTVRELSYGPIWLNDVYGNYIYKEMDEEYTDFIESLNMQGEFEYSHDYDVLQGMYSDPHAKENIRKEYLHKVSTQDMDNSDTKDPSWQNRVIRNMILLNNDIFARNPEEFAVLYISDLIGCRRVYVEETNEISSDCLLQQAKPFTRNKAYEKESIPLQEEPMQIDLQKKLFLFLSDPLNPRVLYRANSEEIEQLSKNILDPNHRARMSKMSTSSNAYRSESGAKLGLSSEINPIISPSLYIKQITFITHFYKSFFLVLTKKTLLSIYDYESKSVYYLYKIQEEESYTELYVVGSELFVLKIKKSSNTREYFKILIFKFCEESMSVTLVNSKTRLINYMEANVLFYDDMVYLITVKQSFFGLTIYRFDGSEEMVSYESLTGEKDDYQNNNNQNNKLTTLHKNTVSFKKHFANILVIETYLKKINNSKIKCRKNKFDFIECLIQFPTLDNILIGLKLKNKTHKTKSTEEETDLKRKATFNDQPQNLFYFNKEKSTYKKQRQFDFTKKTVNQFVVLNSLKLIRNPYPASVITKYTNYFFKKYLILVYEVHSFVRLYFYYLGTPDSPEDQMHSGDCTECKTHTSPDGSFSKIIDFCEKESEDSYKNLYYRLEIEKNKAKFLYLRFSYDLGLKPGSSKEKNLNAREIVNIVKVVFDSRIETYQFNNNIRIKLKKNTLDFDNISLYAKNHNNVVKGRSSLTLS